MGICPNCKTGKSNATPNEIFVPQFDSHSPHLINKNKTVSKLLSKRATNKKKFHRLTTERIILRKKKKKSYTVILKKIPKKYEKLFDLKKNVLLIKEFKKVKSLEKINKINFTTSNLPKKGKTTTNKTPIKRFKTTIKLKKEELNNKNNNNDNNNNLNNNETEVNQNIINEKKNVKYELSEQTLSRNEENYLSTILSSHYLFQKIKKENLLYIINELKEFQIEEKTSIFYKGDDGSCLFIIKEGKVEISLPSKKKLILDEGNIFGELALINDNIVRNYDAFALTDLNFYIIDLNSFSEISREILYKTNFQCIIFSGFDMNVIENLEYLTLHSFFKKGHVINDLNCLYEINNGELTLVDENDNEITNYKNGDYFDLKNTFFADDYEEDIDYDTIFKYNSDYKLIAKEDTSCNIFPAFAFIELFGTNYKHKILFNFLKFSLSKEKIFEEIINENYDKIYPIFKIKEYKKGDYIYDIEKQKEKKKYKKISIIIAGTAIKKTGIKKFAKNINLFPGDILGIEYPFGLSPLNIVVNSNHFITFECYYDDFLTNIPIKESNLKEFIINLKQIYLFKNLKGFVLINIIKCLNVECFKKDDKIIKKGDIVNKVYYIIKGKAKFIVDNETYKEYNQGNSFGEIFLLNEKKAKSEIICSSEELILYSISKQDFYELMKDPKLNDLIKRKLCLEDIELFPNSLYYLSTLYNGKYSKIYLVHNKIFFYTIKAIYIDNQKKKNPKNIISLCIINEKKSSKRLDHPFIISYVKTLKNNNWCFFVEEYLNGITLSQFIQINKQINNLKIIRFYAASLFVILENLKYRGIIHRDIKAENIILTKNGYIKLIDFSSSKRIKKNKTNSLIGTPLYLPPEIINGQNYSYSCDYWSVGILLYLLYYGEFPFGNLNQNVDSIYKEILNKNINYKENENQDNVIFKNFLEKILEKDDKKRLCSYKDIIQNEFFNGFNFKLLKREKMQPPFFPQIKQLDDENLLTNLLKPFNNFIQQEKLENNNNITKAKETIRNFQERSDNNNITKESKSWFDDF